MHRKKNDSLFAHSLFRNTELKATPRKYPKMDINGMYERAFDELTLQQSKRDQLITIYLAAFAFIVPALLTSATVNWVVSGWIFAGLGIIGYLFALIIIRYRKYKEAYWICCRTFSVMMTLEEEDWTKENIQAIFFRCMRKKVRGYIGAEKFEAGRYVRDNFFSGETLYLVIHSIIAGSVFGLGVGMLLPFAGWIKAAVGLVCGGALFCLSVRTYFATLLRVYSVCVDGTEKSFNRTFGDAWFLHFFVD